MKYIIKEAVPVIKANLNQRGSFDYKIDSWDIKFAQWDGMCMCTIEHKEIILPLSGLSYTKNELIQEIKKATQRGVKLL